MSADVWFKRDIAQILLSNWQATANAMAASGAPNMAYVTGYRAAVASVALAFGIEPALVILDGALGPERARLEG